MKKIIAVAALTAASFAVPVLPVQADELQLNCFFLPFLQDECKPAWLDDAEDAPAAAVAATSATVEAVVDWSWPSPPNCEPAAEGSKYLFDCDM